jgi:glutamate--cysteine ligase
LYKVFETRLASLERNNLTAQLLGGLIGLEKESLRVSPAGRIAQTPHPRALGSPLTHPYITTDYSEALTELITPPYADGQRALEFLRSAHKLVYDHLGDETLWATSMPCVMSGAADIPIARYGTSNQGMMKTVYRRGLGHRYGRVMQVIAGVHFNYSVPEGFWPLYQELEGNKGPRQAFVSECYFAILRNLQRVGWIVPYLFGASPAVCKSFLGGKPTKLQSFDDTTYYAPYATSLRMGDIGYQNSKEEGTGIKACYDSLNSYVETLSHAIETPCPIYQAIGVKENGEYKQLNANILQIENEYYSTVRPKQIPEDLEKPVLALKRRGVRYLELRSLDVNAYHPLGIDEDQVVFLELLMLFCLLFDSPPINVFEQREIDRNEGAAAHRGRDPKLYLQRNGREISLKSWGLELIEAMSSLATMLDACGSNSVFQQVLEKQRQRLLDPEETPSAIMLREMRENGEGFFDFAERMSLLHRDAFSRTQLEPAMRKVFDDEARRSWEKQQAIEDADAPSFDDFLQAYFAQY